MVTLNLGDVEGAVRHGIAATKDGRLGVSSGTICQIHIGAPAWQLAGGGPMSKTRVCDRCSGEMKFAGRISLPPQTIYKCVTCGNQEWDAGPGKLTSRGRLLRWSNPRPSNSSNPNPSQTIQKNSAPFVNAVGAVDCSRSRSRFSGSIRANIIVVTHFEHFGSGDPR
jgi:hypothetical protein